MVFITRIPTHYNDGTPIPPEVIQRITDQVYDLFGGWTMDDPAEGGWVDDEGNRYTEKSRRLEVSCKRDQYATARELVIRIGRRPGQKAMYFEVRYFDGVEIITIPSVPGQKRGPKRKK